LAVKKTVHGAYLYFAHNTDSFVSLWTISHAPQFADQPRLLRQWVPKTPSRHAQCLGVMEMGWWRQEVVLSGSDGAEGGLYCFFLAIPKFRVQNYGHRPEGLSRPNESM